jgi:deoxyribodipyrimidine photo-lyase
MIQKERIKALNEESIKNGRYILHWMQASQRVEFNHALEYAISKANELSKPLVVYFGIAENYPEAYERHYYFMLEGLKEVQSSLRKKDIKMVVRPEQPEIGVPEMSKNACLVVVDRGYLRIQRAWRTHVAKQISCPLIQVETDVVVPVEEASPKEEYSAATFRPKIRKKLGYYLLPLQNCYPSISSLGMNFDSFDIGDTEKAVSRLDIGSSVKKVDHLHGGTNEARKHFKDFLENKLEKYPVLRNDPTQNVLSDMSPYLHFGQISPLYIALKVSATNSFEKDAYLEELIVRRELAVNFVFYNQNCDSFDGLPEWAKKTLNEHSRDTRQYTYTLEELEDAKTHDPYWNAAQQEMKIKGKMHGYMRMYWGKKILEWSNTPQKAFQTALHLNNKYELDGRDPNGYAGVAWCFGKHDRAWKERNVFGKVRYMNAKGLKRKFDADNYVEMVKEGKP